MGFKSQEACLCLFHVFGNQTFMDLIFSTCKVGITKFVPTSKRTTHMVETLCKDLEMFTKEYVS